MHCTRARTHRCNTWYVLSVIAVGKSAVFAIHGIFVSSLRQMKLVLFVFASYIYIHAQLSTKLSNSQKNNEMKVYIPTLCLVGGTDAAVAAAWSTNHALLSILHGIFVLCNCMTVLAFMRTRNYSPIDFVMFSIHTKKKKIQKTNK